MKKALIIIVTIIFTVGIVLGGVYVILFHPDFSLQNTVKDYLAKIIHTDQVSVPVMNNGDLVLLAKGTGTSLSNVKDISLAIDRVELQTDKGVWNVVSTTSTRVDLYAVDNKGIGSALGRATVLAETYKAIRYTLRDVEITKTDGSIVQADIPSPTFVVTTDTQINPNEISTLTLEILNKQSLTQQGNGYVFAPTAIATTRIRAGIYLSSDIKTVAILSEGEAQAVTQTVMFSNGDSRSTLITHVVPAAPVSQAVYSSVPTKNTSAPYYEPASYKKNTSTSGRTAPVTQPISVPLPTPLPQVTTTPVPTNQVQPFHYVDSGTDNTIGQPIVSDPPVFDYIATQEIIVGHTLNFTVHAVDPEGRTVTYIPVSLPVGAALNQYSGAFSWTPITSGNYSATFIATNAIEGASKTITIIVDPAPVAPPPDPVPPSTPIVTHAAPNSGAVGTTVTVSGSNFDATGNIVVFGSLVVAANVNSSDGLSLTFTIPSYVSQYCAPGSMCPSFATLLDPGTYQLNVINSKGTSNSVSFTVTP